MLLLQHQLPLLHLLQHFLRRLCRRLVRVSRRLFGLSSCLVRGVIGVLLGRIRVIRIRPHLRLLLLPLIGLHNPQLLLFRQRWAIGRRSHILWSCFCHQDHAGQQRIVRRRPQQHIVETRTIQ